MTKTKFYKRVSIKRLFLLGLVISLSSIYLVGILIEVAFAQDTNLCLDGTPSFNIISQKFIDNWYSTASDVNDDNTSTKVGFYAKSMDGPYASYESIVEFTGKARVNSVNYYRYWQLLGKNTHIGYEKVSLFYGGEWHLIHTQNYNSEGSGTGTITITAGAPWIDVTKIKIEAYMYANATFRDPEPIIYHHTYELRAFGLVYEDIGLRVFNGTQTVSIAVEPLGTLTSPLRIAKDGVIYGIPLVDAGDPNESGIRIKTSSGIKALRKYP